MNYLKISGILVLLFLSIDIFSQVGQLPGEIGIPNRLPKSVAYDYDNAGNRISRTIIYFRNQAVIDTVFENFEKPEPENHNIWMEEIKVSVFPNPVKEYINLDIVGTSDYNKISYQIMDLSGRIIDSRKLNSVSATINFNSYNPGTYILRISINDFYEEFKIIKE